MDERPRRFGVTRSIARVTSTIAFGVLAVLLASGALFPVPR
jgi:hypothetical protein